MKPHINIGTIGHVDHHKTALTAAICSALGATLKQPEPDHLENCIAISNIHEEPTPPPPRKPRSPMTSLLAMTAMLAGPFGMGGGSSSAAERNDPNRPKTPQDLERMVAAQAKRERKAARKAQGITTRRP